MNITSPSNQPVLSYRDTSTECGICLSPYEDPCDDDFKTTVELHCGHKWHLDCLRAQLEATQPKRGHRLVFQSCKCAKCGVVWNHQALQQVFHATENELRPKVDRILAKHLQLANPLSSPNSAALVESVRDKYAFYLCYSCNEPYLEGIANKEEAENIDVKRLCKTCQPNENTFEPKRTMTVWKCRYCCQPATHLCNQCVHMCDSCHKRSMQLQQQSSGYVELKSIPCLGGHQCPFPKHRQDHFHSNGPYAACEQLYHVRKESVRDKSAIGDMAYMSQSNSCNLLVNPSGKEGFDGWRRLNYNESWQVETSSKPVSQYSTTNFVSTYFWCSMEQTVDLSAATADPSAARINVSARFMGHEDVPSVFRLQAEVLDVNGETLRKITTRILSAPTEFWELASLVFEPTPKAHSVKITLHGKDAALVPGHFGSKVADCAVRILADKASQ